MNKTIYWVALLSLLFPVMSLPSAAAETDVEVVSIIRYEREAVPAATGKDILPVIEFLDLDMRGVGSDDVSLHLSGWGRFDLADSSSAERDLDSNLAYAYLSYVHPQGNAAGKLGRFFVYDLGPVEQLDGVGGRADLAYGFSLAGYAGVPVRLDQRDDNRGDYLVGARLNQRRAGAWDIGLAALLEGGAASREVTGISTQRQVANRRELVAADFWLAPWRDTETMGHVWYNPVTGGVAEQSYALTAYPARDVIATIQYDAREYADLFAASNLPFLYRPTADTGESSYGGLLEWEAVKGVTVTGEGKRSRSQGGQLRTANRFGGGVKLSLLANKVRGGTNYCRVDAQGDGVNSYHQVRAYAAYHQKRLFLAADTTFDIYDQPVYGRNGALEATSSVGYRLTPELTLALDLTYAETPAVERGDVSGLVKLTYSLFQEQAK